MSDEYRNNHYVPVWYQKRFILPDQRDNELFYLDLKPGTFRDSRGIIHARKSIRRLGFKYCFAQRDLYTLHFDSKESTEIERIFFGTIDSKGRDAVNYFTNFKYPLSNPGNAFENILNYISTQKLRTPKGLSWLKNQVGTMDQNQTLNSMIKLRRLYSAIWTECIWLIADSSKSNTKFIVSDHPVTVYNRRCGPRSQWCREFNDPDIRYHATHTIFPLSLEKILILTNLSWIRNPYQDEVGMRPNPNPWRDAIFKFTDIQTLRYLSEQEVREINFVIKSRAFRYIGAAQEDWLFPDKYISKSHWNIYGGGYLFMPDPRAVSIGGEIFMGYRDGTTTGFDEYGRRPWESEFSKETKTMKELETLYRFKGEFARLYGPCRRGRTFNVTKIDNECDDDEYHKYHLSLEKKKMKK